MMRDERRYNVSLLSSADFRCKYSCCLTMECHSCMIESKHGTVGEGGSSLVVTGASCNRSNISQCLDQEVRRPSPKEQGNKPYLSVKSGNFNGF